MAACDHELGGNFLKGLLHLRNRISIRKQVNNLECSKNEDEVHEEWRDDIARIYEKLC